MSLQIEYDAASGWGRIPGHQSPSAGVGTPPFDSNGAYFGYFPHLDYPTVCWWFNEALRYLPLARETNRCYLAGWHNSDGWVMTFKEKDGLSNKPVLYFNLRGQVRSEMPVWVYNLSNLEYTRRWLTSFYEAVLDRAHDAALHGSPFLFPRPWFGPTVLVAPSPPAQDP